MNRWLLAFIAVFLCAQNLNAQSYPNKPVHVIISFIPGSSTDIVGRVVFAKVSEYWGQPVVAENRGGAGGSIGSVAVARAAPDGYTLLINSVDCYWAPISAGLSAIKGGKLRALAVSTAKRNPALPDVPTPAEAGVKNAESALWFGVWGPAGLPQDIAQKISADVRKALADPGVKEKLVALGNDTMDMSPPEFARFVREEIETYQRVIRDAGIKPQ